MKWNLFPFVMHHLKGRKAASVLISQTVLPPGKNVLLGYCSAKYSDLLLVMCDLHVYKLTIAVIYYFLQAFQN